MSDQAGSVTIQITANTTAFEAALAKARQQAVAFDAQISAQLNGAGVSAGLEKIAAGVVELGVVGKETAGFGAGVSRECSVLGSEVLRGNFSRIPGSLLVMNERLAGSGASVLTLANGMKALGALGNVIFNPFVLGF